MLAHQTKRRGRERALEYMFGLEFTKNPPEDGLAVFWETFSTNAKARAYAESLVEGVVARLEELDEQINGALKGWTPERVGRVERIILRIGLYEMTCVEDVPMKVAINEAIEITKLYGMDESPKFVNGVLNRLKESEQHENAG